MIGTGIDLTPLVGIANLAITTFATVATAAIPIAGYFAIQWLRAHAAQTRQATQTAAAAQADSVIQKGIAYANQIGVPQVEGAANYAMNQAPQLLKTLGFDPATDAGKAAVTRMVTARLVPPPTPPATLDVNVTATEAPKAA